MGYGWTDNWASSLIGIVADPGGHLRAGRHRGRGRHGAPLTQYAANGQAPASAPLGAPGGVLVNSGNVYYADTQGNRIIEVPGTSGTQWGISMTAGRGVHDRGLLYRADRVVESVAGAATSALLASPEGLAMDSAGDLIDREHRRHAGRQDHPVPGRSARSPDPGHPAPGPIDVAATSSALDQPDIGRRGQRRGPLHRRLRQQPDPGGRHGHREPVGPVDDRQRHLHRGRVGRPGARGAARTAPTAARCCATRRAITVDGSTDMYIADTGNNRVIEIPKAAGNPVGLLDDRQRHLHRRRDRDRHRRAPPATAATPTTSRC